MGDRIDRLFQEWYRLGGAVLLDQVDRAVPVRLPEAVIAESTAHCRESGRLTWVVLDWLIHHIQEIDEQKLLKLTKSDGDPSVLGVLCDAANQRNQHPKFERLMRACASSPEVEPFFYRVARSPLALSLARSHPIDIFLRWNYVSSELRYLS